MHAHTHGYGTRSGVFAHMHAHGHMHTHGHGTRSQMFAHVYIHGNGHTFRHMHTLTGACTHAHSRAFAHVHRARSMWNAHSCITQAQRGSGSLTGRRWLDRLAAVTPGRPDTCSSLSHNAFSIFTAS